ncbi:hypothetical protein ACROYT_G021684 [Oculina patagonica]
MKLAYLLTALTFFLLLSYLTYPAEREEIPRSVEKQDFFFKDFAHGTSITGSWLDKVGVFAKTVSWLMIG